MREHETLTFDLTDDDLAFAIGLLRERLPEVVCPRAWGILSVEQERRNETKGFAKFPLDMSASAYAELPAEVRARFDARKRPPLSLRGELRADEV
jgi:hypothetical protein